MKKLALLIISFLSVWLMSVDTAWSQDFSQPGSEIEAMKQQLDEGTIPEVEIRLEREKIRIQVGRKAAYFISQEPTADEIRTVFGLDTSMDPLASFHTMDQEERAQFQKIRRTILSKVAQALISSNLMTSAGVLVHEKYQIIKKYFSEEVAETDNGKNVKSKKLKVRQREMIQAFLQAIDYRLWLQAPLLLNANEFGLQISIGGYFQAGIGGEKGWALNQEIGLSFAYNKELRAFVFEVYDNKEKHHDSLTPMLMAGVKAKIGFTASYAMEKKSGTSRGYSDNAFMSSFYNDHSESHFGYGAKLGLKFPPFGNLFSYTNKYERKTLIRISISPVMFGFIHMQVGDRTVSPGLFLYSVRDFMVNIGQFVRQMRGQTCGRVFL